MKLTEREETTKLYLENKKYNNRDFMSPDEREALRRLQAKQAHNTCTNPRCIGYEGAENETTCKKCGAPLHKTL